MRAEKFYWPVLWILGAAVVVAHVLGAGHLRQDFWGADFYGYLPSAALAMAGALLGTALFVTTRNAEWLDRSLLATAGPVDLATPRARWIKGALAIGACFLAFWFLREGHTLLGDGNPLIRDLPSGQRFHPREPLTYLMHQGFYGLTRPLFQAPGRDAAVVAHCTVALSSAIAGALFVPVAWWLAKELARALAPDAAGTDSSSRAIVPLCFVILMAQGYVQLFFGYVENYTFSALMIGIYLLTALRYLRGTGPLAFPAIALVLAVSLALSNVLLVPSFLVLLVRALLDSGRRVAALRDLLLAGALLAGIGAVMASVQPGYHLASAALSGIAQAITGRGDRAQGLAYMFSRVHVRDFLNEQLLIGPGGAYLFVVGLVWMAFARARFTAARGFFLVAGLVSLGGAWVTTDLSLGYPRDWDLFAPSGLVFTAAGLELLLSGAWRGPSLRRWLVLLACVCLFHTVPWIAVNTSFERSFERFKMLPLGLGRAQAVVGIYYLEHGDTLSAIPWFQESLVENPGNNNAAFCLSLIGMHRGRYRWAAQGFWTALQSRPDKDDYRFALVSALVLGNWRPEAARAHLDTLLMKNPREPVYWAARGVVCLGLGQRDSAAAAFGRAHELAPADSTFRRLQKRVSEPDGYRSAVREDWPAFAGPQGRDNVEWARRDIRITVRAPEALPIQALQPAPASRQGGSR